MARTAIALALLAVLSLPGASYAQEEEEDSFDEPFDEFPDEVETEEITKPAERQVAEEKEKLADVVRGTYVQAMLTETKYLGLVAQADPYLLPVGDRSYWGVGVKMSVGRELVDMPSFTLGGELSYGQGAFNGDSPNNFPDSPVQGDFRTHTFQLSIKPTLVLSRSRRWSVAFKVTGGGMISEASVSEYNQPVPGLHGTFKPFGGAGLGLEYYSKLAHFSVTLVEGEFLYAPGFDASAGINFVGLKYTF